MGGWEGEEKFSSILSLHVHEATADERRRRGIRRSQLTIYTPNLVHLLYALTFIISKRNDLD